MESKDTGMALGEPSPIRPGLGRRMWIENPNWPGLERHSLVCPFCGQKIDKVWSPCRNCDGEPEMYAMAHDLFCDAISKQGLAVTQHDFEPRERNASDIAKWALEVARSFVAAKYRTLNPRKEPSS